MILTAKSILKYSSITVLSIAFVFYLFNQSITYLKGPSLIITSPEDGTSITTKSIVITGKVERISFISMNDSQIFATESGDFGQKLLLSPGYNIIKIQVKDRFEREITKSLHINYLPDKDDIPPISKDILETISKSLPDKKTSTTTATQPETVDNNN